MEDLIRDWHGEAVVTRFDADTGTWMFIALHDTTLGPAMGGVRMKTYPTPADGLRDAMRLAEGMTYKWAGIGFDLGGGKSVLAVPGPLDQEERRNLLRRFGRMIATLRGAYACGPDLGTTPEDMGVIGEETPYVHGWNRAASRPLDPGPYTALGVFSGMKAALRQVFGTSEFAGRSVLVQGIGDVGVPLTALLADAGATLLLADTDAERASRRASELGAEAIAADDVSSTQCDVYAPCAVGATLNAETITQLGCRAVAGAANNQLGTPGDADALHARGILYTPDYIANAGGATALPLLGQGEEVEAVRERIRGVEATLDDIFREAEERSESPYHSAQRRVERVLAERRSGRR